MAKPVRQEKVWPDGAPNLQQEQVRPMLSGRTGWCLTIIPTAVLCLGLSLLLLYRLDAGRANGVKGR